MSGHRPLAPASGQRSSSSVPSGESGGQYSPSQSGSNPFSSMSSAGSESADSNRRRRQPGHISAMACTECRHARQRCDGQRPTPCSRCEKRKLQCVYEPHVKTHKDDLIKEIQGLRVDKSRLEDEKKQMAEASTDLESENRDLQESSSWSNTILETIKKNGHDREIVAKLRAGVSHHDVADWLLQKVQVEKHINIESLSSQHSRQSLLGVVRAFEDQYQHVRATSTNEPVLFWTNVSTSHILVGHLFDLYFTWIHPIHMLFSELDFRYSFQNNDGPYCSRPLVNAICAMACHLLENENENIQRNEVNQEEAATLREGFMNEARKYLSTANRMDLTTVQTFSVMYLVGFSSGKARSAVGYLRSAVEGLSTATGGQSDEAREITTWGVNCLNTASVGITYQKFYTPDFPHEVTFNHVRLDKDDEVWRFYRSVGDEEELPTRQSHAILTTYYQARLLRVCRDCLNLYCGYGGRITAQKVISVYKAYTDWKEDLPPPLQELDPDAQPLPNVMYLHIIYHVALLQHLTPLVYCNYFSPADENELRRMLVYHARCGLEILELLRRLYSTRYQTPLLSFCILHLGDTLLRYSPTEPPGTDVAVFCLEMLARTSAGFVVCGPLSALFRQTTEELDIELPPDLDERIGPPMTYTVDDILDACTRLTYRQPTEQTVRHMDRSLADDWAVEWESQVVEPRLRKDSGTGRFLQIGSLLND